MSFGGKKLQTAGLLVIRGRKLLLAFSNNKQCYYLPGGKVDVGESAAKALCREIAEELNVSLYEDNLKFYTHISALAFGEEEGIIMEQDCFFTYKKIEPKASSEIGEIKYFSLEDYLKQQNQAPGAVMILKKLKANGFID